MKNISQPNSTLPAMFAKLLILLPFFISAQGCYSLAGSTKAGVNNEQTTIDNVELLESKRKNAEVTLTAVKKELAALTALKKEIADLSAVKKEVAELKSVKRELAELKPSINRLLALEYEFTELVDTMHQVNLEPNLFADTTNQESAFLSNKQPVPENDFLPPSTFVNTGKNTEKFSSSTADNLQGKFNQVSVGSAPPLLNVKTQATTPIENSPASKLGMNDDKFSVRARLLPDNVTNIKVCSQIAQGKGYAMHIASFRNKESAKTLLKSLINKVNQADTCQKEAFIANVYIEEKVFFSARIGSFSSKLEATEACTDVKEYAAYCGVTKNVGELL
jgi:hypothetical protein